MALRPLRITHADTARHDAFLRYVPIASAILMLGCAGSGERRCEPLVSGSSPATDTGPGSACSGSSGSQWVDLGYPGVAAPATAIVATDREVFVGTTDGVWRREIDGSTGWLRAGLSGRYIRTLVATGDVLMAGAGDYETAGTFHRSSNLARNDWCTSGSDVFQFSLGGQVQGIPIEQLVRDPGPEAEGIGVLYANMSGPSIAASIDGGAAWRYVLLAAEIYASPPCVLHITGSPPDVLYQGCEAPADMAFIRSFDVSSRNGMVGAPVTLVGSDAIGNRRPNSFASSAAAPDVLYAGLEGALVQLRSATWSWIFEYPIAGTGTFGQYAYIKVIWVDPCSGSHLVFGGPTQARASFELYETFDGGATLSLVSPPATGATPVVLAGAPGGDAGRDLVLLTSIQTQGDVPVDSFRVIVRRHVP